MNDTYIVTVYVVIDDLLRVMQYQDDGRAEMSAAEILTVAVVIAKGFQNHQERALYLLVRLGYLRTLSVSRFNRRWHAWRDWVWRVAKVVGELLAEGTVFVADTRPVPSCKRVPSQALSQGAGASL